MTKNHGPDIEAADVLRMFPTFVWKAELKPDVYQEINENILTKLDQLRETLPELAPGQAWQSDQALHELDEFHRLTRLRLRQFRPSSGGLVAPKDWTKLKQRPINGRTGQPVE